MERWGETLEELALKAPELQKAFAKLVRVNHAEALRRHRGHMEGALAYLSSNVCQMFPVRESIMPILGFMVQIWNHLVVTASDFL